MTSRITAEPVAVDDTVRELLREMESKRGYIYPTHQYLAEQDPAFLAIWNQLAGLALGHDESPDQPSAALPVKYREMIVSVLLAYRGSSTEGITAHVKRAIAHGATMRELLEAFEASVVPGGAPTFLAGVRAIMAAEEGGQA